MSGERTMDGTRWVCPACGRGFARTEQSHYCGRKPETIEAYIAAQPEEKRGELSRLRAILRAALPETAECIAWSMPTYRLGKRNVLHFAASKKHIGLYPGPEAVLRFADALKERGYSTDKGTVRIPYGDIDETLITELAGWCGARVAEGHRTV